MNRFTSSKGNQYKFFKEGYWYKAEYLGYEALAEVAVTFLLMHSNVSDYVRYQFLRKNDNEIPTNFTKSKNFLGKEENIITLQKLFRLYLGVELHCEVLRYSNMKERIRYVVDSVETITGLQGFGEYLTLLLELDAVTLDDDRHFNNIALKYDTNTFTTTPLFDFGAAFFSDVRVSYPLNIEFEELLKRAKAKPFSNDFDEQVDAAEELYGTQLKIYGTANEICTEIDTFENFYEKRIIDRVKLAVRNQMRKYQYLQNF